MPRVLFVCTANICRSPIAQGLLEKRLQEHGSGEAWEVHSAGTWTEEGRRAHRTVQMLMKERGIDLSEHRTREVDGDLLAVSDLVLTMTPGQKEALQVEFPAQAEKVYLLSELVGKVDSVEDPHGNPERTCTYRETVEKIAGYLEGVPESLEVLLKEG